MSITISDILKLPSLREAKVVSGFSSLQKTISSITVLESDDPIVTGGEAVFNNPFSPTNLRSYGSEIVITAFVNSRNSIEAQCNTIRGLYGGGEAALIVYYIGQVIPCLDKKVIETAQKLDFPIITMPENRMELRYSDVIAEVMEAIVKDRLNDTYFAAEIMEKISHLQKNQRNINSVLSMLRDRIHCSLFVIDDSMRIINGAEWPRDRGLPYEAILEECSKCKLEDGIVTEIRANRMPFFVIKSLLDDSNGIRIHLIVIKETEDLTLDICKQCWDVLKTYLNLWSENHGNIETKQLISAVLNDEPEKMRRIAQILHINIKAISVMVVLSPIENIGNEQQKYAQLAKGRELLNDFAKGYKNISIADVFESSIVLFTDTVEEMVDTGLPKLLEDLSVIGIEFKMSVFDMLLNSTMVKEAYELNRDYMDSAILIYPDKKIFTNAEINFAKRCNDICQKGDKEISYRKRKISQLMQDEKKQELLETLTVYLLDAESNVAKTSEIMFVHKNTIKYRIGCLKKLLGYDINRMPETYDLYIAVALERLIESR